MTLRVYVSDSNFSSKRVTVVSDSSLPREWIDKLEIREVIERSVRSIDDRAGDR